MASPGCLSVPVRSDQPFLSTSSRQFRMQNSFPVIFRLAENAMPQLLELPTDLIRLILSSYVARSPLSHITARFVCRRFRDLLPPLSKETRQQARDFCNLASKGGYLNLIKWARANGWPCDDRTCTNAGPPRSFIVSLFHACVEEPLSLFSNMFGKVQSIC